MSPDEAKRLLAMASSLKVRVLLSLGYGCGLRAGEVVRLKAGDVDSAQSIIRIVQAKGRKDRNVMLSPEVLGLLRQWWKVRPTRYDAGVPAGAALAVPWPRAGQANDDPPAEPPVPPDSRCGRDQEGGDAARAAPQLCNSPPGARHRHPPHPGAARPRQARHDGALHARCHRHDRQRQEPARPAIGASTGDPGTARRSPKTSRRRSAQAACLVQLWRSPTSSATSAPHGVAPTRVM